MWSISFWKIYFKFLLLNFSYMANIQNGFNTWYIARIQTRSSQYRNKCRMKWNRGMTRWHKFISSGNIDWVWFLRTKISFQSDILGSLIVIVCPTLNQKHPREISNQVDLIFSWKSLKKSLKILEKIFENPWKNLWKSLTKSLKILEKIFGNLWQNLWKSLKKSLEIFDKIFEKILGKPWQNLWKSLQILDKIFENPWQNPCKALQIRRPSHENPLNPGQLMACGSLTILAFCQ